jgi:hypothetical protein
VSLHEGVRETGTRREGGPAGEPPPACLLSGRHACMRETRVERGRPEGAGRRLGKGSKARAGPARKWLPLSPPTRNHRIGPRLAGTVNQAAEPESGGVTSTVISRSIRPVLANKPSRDHSLPVPIRKARSRPGERPGPGLESEVTCQSRS